MFGSSGFYGVIYNQKTISFRWAFEVGWRWAGGWGRDTKVKSGWRAPFKVIAFDQKFNDLIVESYCFGEMHTFDFEVSGE